MSISLPPPEVPSQADASVIRAESQVTQFQFREFTFRLFGADVVSAEDLATIAERSESLSEVVQRINFQCYAAGYPACQTRFARVGNEVLVLVQLRGVESVDVPPPLSAYFEGLAGRSPLTAGAFERRRVLAALHAERAGLAGQPVFSGPLGQTTLKLDPAQGDEAAKVAVEFGNPGTRFTGRYFASYSLNAATRWGDEFSVGWRDAFSGLGQNPNDGDYHELTPGWTRVTPYGIFGANARRVRYDFRFGDRVIDATILQYEGLWLNPWLADFRQRLFTQVKVDRTENSIQFSDGPRRQLQNEFYTSAEVAALYSRNQAVLGRVTQLETSLTVRKGLSDGIAEPSLANRDYLLYRPVLTFRAPVVENWPLSLTLAAQFSSDRTPEQSQWVLGGLDNLTGFLPGAAVGDKGSLARLVLGTPQLQRGAFTLKPSLLVEGGTARFNAGGEERRLANAGLRVDANYGRYVDASLAFAEPIVEKGFAEGVADQLDANLYFRLRLSF